MLSYPTYPTAKGDLQYPLEYLLEKKASRKEIPYVYL